MAIGWNRPTKLTINMGAIRSNILQEKELAPNKALFAVVKADGYGHGANKVAEAAREAGAEGFCVAIEDEGTELRRYGFSEPILVMGVVNVEAAIRLAPQNISVAVASYEWLKEAEALLSLTQYKLQVHLKIDTGMGRVGFTDTEELMAAEKLILSSNHLELEGVFTHFATADMVNTDYFNQQVAKFREMKQVLKTKARYIHTANSATALWHDACESNLIRFGIAMYGLNPSTEQESPYSLTPALSLTTELVHVKQIKPGNCISYGATYQAEEAEWIGTLPIGYADGWLRKMQGFHVLIEGNYCELVGRICMDQCMVRLPKNFQVGTIVTLIGKNDKEIISTDEVAKYRETINYEVTCGFTNRVPRFYL